MPGNNQTRGDGDKSGRTRRTLSFGVGRVLAALLIFLVLVLSAAVILHRSLLRAYAPSILNQLASEFEYFYDMEFTWDGYSITGLNDFTISGVILKDIPSDTGFIELDSMRVRTSLPALAIRGQDPMSAVTSIELINPRILIGREDGRWNTGKLFEPGDGEAFEFPGRLAIIIQNGVVEWRGGEFADGVNIPPLQIAGLQGYFRLGLGGGMGLNLDGTLSGHEIEPTGLSMQGSYDPEIYLMQVNASIDALDLRIASDLANTYEVSGLSGTAGLDISILLGPDAGESGFSLLGKADINDGGASIDTYSLETREINGEIHFSHASVFTSGLSAEVDGAVLNISGHTGDFSSESISANLMVEGTGVRTASIRKIIPGFEPVPLDGSINIRAELTVSGDEVEAVVSADSQSLSYMAYPFTVNNIFAWYADEKLVVNTVDAGIFGGSIMGDGVIDFTLEEPAYEFRVALTDLPSGQFKPFLPAESQDLVPNGTISADAVIAGAGSDMPVIAGVGKASNLTIPAYPSMPGFEVTIPFETYGESVRIAEASIVGDGATVLGEGNFDAGTGFAGTFAVVVDDPEFWGKMLDTELTGTLTAAGDISWSAGEGINFDGETCFSDMVFRAFETRNLSCRVAYSNEIIYINDLSGFINNGAMEGEIAIPVTGGKPGLDSGSFLLSGFNAASIVPDPYARLVSTSMDIAGDLSYLEESGTLVASLKVIDNAAQFGPNAVTTNGEDLLFTITIPLDNFTQTAINLSGSLNFHPVNAPVYQGRILTPYSSRIIRDVTDLLTGEVLQAQDEETIQIPAIDGTFRFDAEVQNLLGQLTGSLNLSCGELITSGINFASVSLAMATVDAVMWNIDLSVDARDLGVFNLDGSIMRSEIPGESTMSLAAVVSDAGLDSIFTTMGVGTPGHSSGTINGSGMIEGTLDHPAIENFSFNIGQAETFGIPLDQGSATFSFDSPMLNVTGLEIDGTSGFRALGAGSMDMTQLSLTNATMVLRIDEFDLGVVSSVIGTDIPIEGTASGVVQLLQDALGPKYRYTASVQGLVFHSLLLGDVHLGAEYRADDPQIKINELELTNVGETLLLTGLIPADFHNSTDDLFDLSLTSDTGYGIPMLSDLVKSGVAWEGGLGPVNVTLRGSIDTPQLNGELNIGLRNIRYGTYTVAESLGGPITAVDSVITADPDTFRINSNGWVLGIDVEAHLLNLVRHVGTVAEASLVMVTDEPIRLAGPGFELFARPGVGENAPMFKARYELLDLKYRMLGEIEVLGGRIDLAGLPEFPARETDPDIPDSPFSFDLNATVLSGVRIQNGNMLNMTVEQANVRMSGNLAYPVLTGSVAAPDGWIDLFGNHFVFVEPLELTLSSMYPPTNPYITATGRTHLREVRSPGANAEELVITARINSRLSNLLDNLVLTSEPPLGQDSIMAALAWEDFYVRTIGNTLVGDSSMSPGFDNINFGGTVLPIATALLSQYIRREAGFADFEVSFDENQNIMVYLEKEVFNNIVMYYSQTFGPDADDEYYFGTRYRWRPRSWVGIEIDSDNAVIPQIEYIIPLD